MERVSLVSLITQYWEEFHSGQAKNLITENEPISIVCNQSLPKSLSKINFENFAMPLLYYRKKSVKSIVSTTFKRG
ncbi:hypothetical protein HI914_07437 [Erysiphe necator]|nr:hypothetical protein HI914_07437 [Erysiphe necator]